MKQTATARMYIAIMTAAALASAASPATAQSIGSGYYASHCRYVGGRISCPGAAAGYERWGYGNSTADPGFSGSSAHHYFPHNWGGYSTFYGYGR